MSIIAHYYTVEYKSHAAIEMWVGVGWRMYETKLILIYEFDSVFIICRVSFSFFTYILILYTFFSIVDWKNSPELMLYRFDTCRLTIKPIFKRKLHTMPYYGFVTILSPFHMDRFAYVRIYLHICTFAHVCKWGHANGFTHVCKNCSICKSFTLQIYSYATLAMWMQSKICFYTQMYQLRHIIVDVVSTLCVFQDYSGSDWPVYHFYSYWNFQLLPMYIHF